jgi:hypothetical protein
MALVNIVSQSGEHTKRVVTGPRLIISPPCVDWSKSTEIKSWKDKKKYSYHLLSFIYFISWNYSEMSF